MALTKKRVLLTTDGEVLGFYAAEKTGRGFSGRISGRMFTSETEDDEVEADASPSLVVLFVDEETYLDMGSPSTITATIEPGDNLNEAWA